MCVAAIIPAITSAFGLGATAAGATAGAATAGAAATGAGLAGTLQTIGTLATIGGTLYSGIAGASAARQTRADLKAQAATEAQLTATEDARQRAKTARLISQQRAELVARGISLDSPTAIALGQTAARELSFDSQAMRSGGAARQSEISSQVRLARATGLNSILKGTFGAAGDLLTAAPDIWPGLMQPRGATA